MPSRMEKYYQTDNTINRRTNKNKDLYNEIHNNLDYDSIRPVSNVNEISPAKLTEILNNENKIETKNYQIRNRKINIDDNNEFSLEMITKYQKDKQIESNLEYDEDYDSVKQKLIELGNNCN